MAVPESMNESINGLKTAAVLTLSQLQLQDTKHVGQKANWSKCFDQLCYLLKKYFEPVLLQNNGVLESDHIIQNVSFSQHYILHHQWSL